MSQLEALAVGSHVFAVYADIEHELDECFAFLKAGFDNGEAVWIAEEDLTKQQIRERIRKEWHIDNVEELEAKGDIIITTSQEWYYPDGNFELDKVVAKWHRAVEDAVARGKKGLRAFDSVDGLLKDGFADDLVAFETALGTSFKIPFTAICAYKAPDVIGKITAEQISTLHISHGLHRSFGYDVLENPLANQHIALMYESDKERDVAMARYINEGLKQNQLCIYASIHMRDSEHKQRIFSLIDDCEANVTEGNLIVLDLAPYYIAAMSDDFGPFEALKEQLNSKIANRPNKQVRFAGDGVDLLFKNRHFDQCFNLESWWQEKQFEGSYLCCYSKAVADKFPYNIHKFRILAMHDILVDASGKIISANVSEKGRHGQ